MSTDSPWRQPNRWVRFAYEGHKTCWNCDHLRVAKFLQRQCSRLPDVLVPPIPFGELENSGFAVKVMPTETIADGCWEYSPSPALIGLPDQEVMLFLRGDCPQE